MKRKTNDAEKSSHTGTAFDFKRIVYGPQVQLVKLQNQVIRKELKILVVFERRDAAGKDGTIKRIVRHLSPRDTRIVALPKPTDRDGSGW